MHFTTVIVSTLALAGFAVAAPAPSTTRGTPVITTAGDGNVPLATFNILWFKLNLGLPSIAQTYYGSYGTCYNTDGSFSKITGSITLPTGAAGCWVYPLSDCSGAYTVVGPKGTGLWEGASGSFICDAPAS